MGSKDTSLLWLCEAHEKALLGNSRAWRTKDLKAASGPRHRNGRHARRANGMNPHPAKWGGPGRGQGERVEGRGRGHERDALRSNLSSINIYRVTVNTYLKDAIKMSHLALKHICHALFNLPD